MFRFENNRASFYLGQKAAITSRSVNFLQQCIISFFFSCLQKLYQVPPYTKEILYTRVNHNKYMVTETVAYVGTSNWSADYFVNTGGIGYVINETETGDTVRAKLQAVFERNWNSTYTTPLYCKD